MPRARWPFSPHWPASPPPTEYFPLEGFVKPVVRSSPALQAWTVEEKALNEGLRDGLKEFLGVVEVVTSHLVITRQSAQEAVPGAHRFARLTKGTSLPFRDRRRTSRCRCGA